MQLLVASIAVVSWFLSIAKGDYVDIHLASNGGATIGTTAYQACGARTGSGRSKRSLENSGLLRQPRIVKGSEADVNDLAFMAAILRNGAFVCSGFIIHPRFIMTYAKCYDGSITAATPYAEVTTYTAKTGSRDYQNGDEVTLGLFVGFPTDAIPNLIGPLGNWGLFRVTGTTDTIQNYGTKALPICLGKSITTDNRVAEFAGWGTQEKSGSSRQPSSRLRRVDMKILARSNCNFKYSIAIKYTFTKRKMIDGLTYCARTNNGGGMNVEGPCEYDKGGPLFLSEQGKWTAVGIFSDIARNDNKCGQWFSPAAFTNIQQYFTDLTRIVVTSSDAGDSTATLGQKVVTEIGTLVATFPGLITSALG